VGDRVAFGHDRQGGLPTAHMEAAIVEENEVSAP